MPTIISFLSMSFRYKIAQMHPSYKMLTQQDMQQKAVFYREPKIQLTLIGKTQNKMQDLRLISSILMGIIRYIMKDSLTIPLKWTHQKLKSSIEETRVKDRKLRPKMRYKCLKSAIQSIMKILNLRMPHMFPISGQRIQANKF